MKQEVSHDPDHFNVPIDMVNDSGMKSGLMESFRSQMSQNSRSVILSNQQMSIIGEDQGDINHLNSSVHANKHNNRMWIGLSIAASICFTVCNMAIVEVSANMGPFTIFYYMAGGIFSGVVFNISRSWLNYK